MNLNRLAAAILRAVAEELDPPLRESRNADPVTPEPVGNDAPLEVDGSWQPNDVQHHGLENQRGPGFRVR